MTPDSSPTRPSTTLRGGSRSVLGLSRPTRLVRPLTVSSRESTSGRSDEINAVGMVVLQHHVHGQGLFEETTLGGLLARGATLSHFHFLRSYMTPKNSTTTALRRLQSVGSEYWIVSPTEHLRPDHEQLRLRSAARGGFWSRVDSRTP